jgi:peptide/nickel transport system substrate-binding protein
MKKILILLIVLVVAATAFAGAKREAEEPTPQEAPKKVVEEKVIKNPDTLIYATYGTIDSLDPAKTYDSASWTVLATLYETLVDYDGKAVDKFVPVLCEQVPTLENGLVSKDLKTYKFKIRKGIKFHNGYTMTPEDVEFSIERNMVVDVDGGPDWIWFFVFFGTYGSRDDDGNIAIDFKDIDKAVEVDGDYVVFNLANPFPPFVSVLCGKWAGITSKKWVAEIGGWDGTEATWKNYNNPEEGQETLYDVENGTGPYKLARWEKGVEFVVERFDGYWGPKPALARGIYKVVEEWSTRKLMLLQGDADVVQVDPIYYDEMDKEAGITIYRDLPELTVHGINFNQKIAAQDNPYIYSGKLDGNGMPPDFFSDKNVRLGFMYAWDEETYLRDAYGGNAIDPGTPLIKGLPFKNEKLKNRPQDLKKAEEYLKKAWGGQVWEKGFKVDFLYNSGNAQREVGMKMLAETMRSLNPRFQITARAVEWAEYVDLNRNKRLPIFFIGWHADYPDPDNFAYPYMHSTGTYAGRAGYKNPEVDDLIAKAAIEPDQEKRRQMYYRLQDIWFEDAVGIMTHQPITRRYFKDWVKGFYYNPMHSHEFDILMDYKKEY